MNTFLNPSSFRKKILYVFVFSSVCLLQAQKSQPLDSIQPKHEVRLDIFQLIVLPGIDVSYENYIDELSSWGISAFLNLDSFYLEGYRFERFEISPYYRLYFWNIKDNNAGFFVQPFFSLTKGIYDTYDQNYQNYNEEDFFGLSGGALIGQKWVNKKNYTFEIHAGVGRYFAFDKGNAYQEGTAYPRINFSIGKRF